METQDPADSAAYACCQDRNQYRNKRRTGRKTEGLSEIIDWPVGMVGQQMPKNLTAKKRGIACIGHLYRLPDKTELWSF